MDNEAKLLRMDPRALAWIEDVVHGGRKLVSIDESGLGYFDLLGADETPKQLWSGLKPTPAQSIPELLADIPDPDMSDALVEIWSQLTNKDLDVLTIARAMHWAVENKSIDAELIERMGGEASNKVREARRLVEKALLQV